MMSPFGKLLLVLFAVVILPAFQSGAFLGGSETLDCLVPIIGGGKIHCKLEGYNDFEDFRPRSCEIKCDERWLRLPSWICSGGGGACTSSVRRNILKWSTELEEKKSRLVKEWCTCS
uniref:Putative secreted protein n=2 Tax=Ixodes ricinus TaxID=34613 RepID=V5GFK6_IXORI